MTGKLKAKENVCFDEMESHSDQEGAQQKKRKMTSKRGKTSPRKTKRGKSHTKSPKGKMVTTFMEDDNEVQFEVADADLGTIFPTQEEQQNEGENPEPTLTKSIKGITRSKGNKRMPKENEPTTSNNNATPVSQSMEEMDEGNETESSEDKEEGEMDYGSEDSDQSVQISEKTKKYFEEQKRLEEECNQKLIDRTMDQGKKLLIGKIGEDSEEGNKNRGTRSDQHRGNERKGGDTNVSPISLNNSVSESTIYNRAVHSVGSTKRGSSSSDDFIDTSDEIMDISSHIDQNLSLIAESVRNKKRDSREDRSE